MKKLGFFIVTICLLVACSDAKPHLEEILERGELRVLSRYGPTSYFVQGDQLAGFEYELAQQFADYLNVRLKIIVPDSLSSMLTQLEQGRADMAAAGLTVTPERRQRYRFGPVYHEVTQQLVYRAGTSRPSDITELGGRILEVVADSSHVENLQLLRQEIPELYWAENHELDSSALLELVQLEMIDFTVADSNELAANQTLFPELRVAFDISDPQPLAWMMPASEDGTLHREMIAFFNYLDENGELDKLIEKYYGHIRRFDYVDTRAIHRRLITHLPQFHHLFKEAGEMYGFDWRLLAAIAYQESHWNPNAVSATGVRGLMMLTQATATELGVENREDPKESIFAGARYLVQMKSRLPDRISEPDLTWLGLAAYNIGLGHLEDARRLTEQNGANPDLWTDVREHLPLLAKQKWYSQTRFGYARGGEPVRYVDNIRRYYDILLHHQISADSPPVTPATSDPIQSLPAAL